jgi:hypothetical protein
MLPFDILVHIMGFLNVNHMISLAKCRRDLLRYFCRHIHSLCKWNVYQSTQMIYGSHLDTVINIARGTCQVCHMRGINEVYIRLGVYAHAACIHCQLITFDAVVRDYGVDYYEIIASALTKTSHGGHLKVWRRRHRVTSLCDIYTLEDYIYQKYGTTLDQRAETRRGGEIHMINYRNMLQYYEDNVHRSLQQARQMHSTFIYKLNRTRRRCRNYEDSWLLLKILGHLQTTKELDKFNEYLGQKNHRQLIKLYRKNRHLFAD